MKALRGLMAYTVPKEVDPENPLHIEMFQQGISVFNDIEHKEGYVIDFVVLGDSDVVRRMDGSVETTTESSNAYAMFVSESGNMYNIYAVPLGQIQLYPDDVKRLIRESWK